jgi:hypothetical protein
MEKSFSKEHSDSISCIDSDAVKVKTMINSVMITGSETLSIMQKEKLYYIREGECVECVEISNLARDWKNQN